MPPPLPQPATLHSTVEITKYLRSRDPPLPSLLSFAEKVLQDDKVFFPRKEEWLLEWLVQRLGEKGDGSAAARCNPGFWGMLLKLLRTSSHASIATILKKHSFLQVVEKTLSEGKALPALVVVGGELEGDEDAMDTDGGESYHTPREEAISAESSGAEERSLSTGSKVEASVLQLLPGVYHVLSYLQEQTSGGARRDSGGVIAALRGTPEFGAQILGSYFEACLVLLEAGKTVPEEWTRSVLNVWKSCIWGNPNSKKLSSVFSTTCLAPVNRLLAFQPPQPTLQPYLEELLLEFIFTPEIIFPSTPRKPSKASSKELTALMEPLKSQTTGRIQLFRLAIRPQLRRSKPDIETVEALVQAIIPFSYARTSPEIFTDLLELLVENNIDLSSETLSLIIDETSGLATGIAGDVRWRLIDLALKLDFDIFLGGSNQQRGGNLIRAIGHTGVGDNSGQILKTLEVLIESYARARNLGGFIEIWVKELRSQTALWEDDAVAKMIGDRLEKNLSGFQIEKIFKEACEAVSGLNWVLIDMLLRGVRTEATEAKIKKYLPKVMNAAETSTSGWRRWRALLRVIQIDKTAVDQGFIQRVKPSTKKDVDPRETLFFKEFQIALSGCNGVLSPEDALGVASLPTSGAGWTGSIKDINNQNLCLALNTGFAGNWLESIEHIGSLPAKEEFVDHFLDMALHTKANEKSLVTARGLWLNMLADGEFFELPTLKDVVMAGLIRRLRPFSDVDCTSQSLTEARNHRQGTNDEAIQKYTFVLDSIVHYPPEAIKRATREKILDTLVLLTTSTSSKPSSELDSKVLQIMDKLWTLGNASSFLATDAAGLVEWASRRSEDIARKVLRHTFSTKEQERSRGFLANVARAVDKAPFSIVENSQRASVIIEEFWKAGQEDAVRELRGKLMNSLEELLAEPGGALPDVNFLQVWRKCWALERSGPEGCRTAMQFARHVTHSAMQHGLSDFLCDKAPAEGGEVLGVAREACVLFCASSETFDQAIETTALVISMLGSKFTETMGFNSTGNNHPHRGGCRQELITAFKEMTERLKNGAFEKCLAAIVDGYLLDILEDPTSGSGYGEVLKTIVGSIKRPGDEPAKERITTCVSKTFSKLSRNLHKMPSAEDFLTVTTCMETILHEKPWAIHQYNIDESLTAITLSASPSSGPRFTAASPDEIYLALCNLTRTILTLHRRRIRGGRYHLVITALQSLLHCIIKRKPASLRKKSDKTVHPPWLLPAHSLTLTQLPPGITLVGVSEGFNHLLGTFCEPSVGSVRHRHAGATAGVDSEREREKREVAGCVGGLLGEVLKGGLMGGFEGDVSIGVGKIFQLLGGEGVKVFARGLDREGRAMLRGMWEEFKKGEREELW